MGWLKSWPELRDVVAVSIGAVVVLTVLGVWAATGRVPPPALLAWLGGLAGGLLGVPAALSIRRILSTGSSSPSPPPPSPPPSRSSSPLPPEARDGE